MKGVWLDAMPRGCRSQTPRPATKRLGTGLRSAPVIRRRLVAPDSGHPPLDGTPPAFKSYSRAMKTTEVQTVVDSASVSTTMMGLIRPSKQDWTDWEATSYMTATAILFRKGSHIPVFAKAGSLTGLYKQCGSLPHAFAPGVRPDDRIALWNESLNRLSRNARAVATVLKKLSQDHAHLEWVRLEAQHFVAAHLGGHRGMFEEDAIPTIANVLVHIWYRTPNSTDVAEVEADLRRLYAQHTIGNINARITVSRSLLESRSPDGNLFRLAFVSSVIARGWYHALAASDLGHSLGLHPLRNRVLMDGEPSSTRFEPVYSEEPSGCEMLVAAAIAGIAIRYRANADRVRCWSECVGQVRRYCEDGGGFEAFDVKEDRAWRSASEFAARAELPFTTATFARWVDRGFFLVPKALSLLVKIPWSLVVGPLSSAVPGSRSPTQRFLRSAPLRGFQFRGLVHSAPGAVRQWVMP